MLEAHRIDQLPADPAVYAMYAGDTTPYVAYVGIAGKSIKQRLSQHLIRRDSSVVTGVSAVSLNPDLIRQVVWWTHGLFYESMMPSKTDQTALQAAELILSERLEPVLRSRGTVRETARALAADAHFRAEMERLFGGRPSGRLCLPPVVARLEDLERRIESLEKGGSASVKPDDPPPPTVP